VSEYDILVINRELSEKNSPPFPGPTSWSDFAPNISEVSQGSHAAFLWRRSKKGNPLPRSSRIIPLPRCCDPMPQIFFHVYAWLIVYWWQQIHLVTHLVWPHQQDKPTREAQGLEDQSMKKPILVFLNLSNPFLKALRLAAPTLCWSSMFHLLISLLEKKILPTVPRAPHFT